MADYIVGLEPGDTIRVTKRDINTCWDFGKEFEIIPDLHNEEDGYGFRCSCGGITYPSLECRVTDFEVTKKRGPW